MARIYQASSIGEVHIMVAIVPDRGQADLLVDRAASWRLAQGDARWYITREKQDATCWIFFTSIDMSDLKVCFVDNPGEACWQKESRYKGRLG